jgi:hypothetical protein
VHQGVDIAGYVADPDGPDASLPPLGGGAVPWLGSFADTVGVIRRYRISQVVFWKRPTPGDGLWGLVAELRRLRIRLRWQLDDVWLLAAGTRAELFGGQPSAVRDSGGSPALRMFGRRLLSLLGGLLLGVAGLVPWIWLRLVQVPRGKAVFREVLVKDLWGHEPRLTLAVDQAGSLKSLPWQWRLAGGLLRGSLSLYGPRAHPAAAAPEVDPRAVLNFWREEPAAPGLTGSWALGPASSVDQPGASLVDIFKQLWRTPGGFGKIPAAATDPSGSQHGPAQAGR